MTVSTPPLPTRGQQRGEVLDALSVRKGERSGRDLGRELHREGCGIEEEGNTHQFKGPRVASVDGRRSQQPASLLRRAAAFGCDYLLISAYLIILVLAGLLLRFASPALCRLHYSGVRRAERACR